MTYILKKTFLKAYETFFLPISFTVMSKGIHLHYFTDQVELGVVSTL